MALNAFGAVRDLSRLHDITSVLIRYGLGDIVRRAGIGTALERAGQILNWREVSDSGHLEPAKRMRMAMEELGPTFVKLGQMLSTREDMFDSSWIAEFEKLQSQVAPLPFSELASSSPLGVRQDTANIVDNRINPTVLSGRFIFLISLSLGYVFVEI